MKARNKEIEQLIFRAKRIGNDSHEALKELGSSKNALKNSIRSAITQIARPTIPMIDSILTISENVIVMCKEYSSLIRRVSTATDIFSNRMKEEHDRIGALNTDEISKIFSAEQTDDPFKGDEQAQKNLETIQTA